jgi:hypothetical protein
LRISPLKRWHTSVASDVQQHGQRELYESCDFSCNGWMPSMLEYNCYWMVWWVRWMRRNEHNVIKPGLVVAVFTGSQGIILFCFGLSLCTCAGQPGRCSSEVLL